MSAFDELWWDLDGTVGWADAREPEAVNYAEYGRGGVRLPPSTEKIALWTSEAAAFSASRGRDINAELWTASGWPLEKQVPPMPIDELNLQDPERPEARALSEAVATAESYQRYFVHLMFSGQFDERDIPSHAVMPYLSADLRSLVHAYCSRAKPRTDSAGHPLRKFPTKDFVLQLLREGRLMARGCLSGEVLARDLTSDDWATLEIEVGAYGAGSAFGERRCLRKTPMATSTKLGFGGPKS
jgi:hypothetical protein